MAAVEVTISGVLFDKQNRTTQQVVLIGEATLTGLAPGGGPIIPPPTDEKPPRPPLGIWPGPGPLPHPEHPIVIPPDEGTKPPDPVQPPIDWKAIWAGPEHGWVVVGVPNLPHPTPST